MQMLYTPDPLSSPVSAPAAKPEPRPTASVQRLLRAPAELGRLPPGDGWYQTTARSEADVARFCALVGTELGVAELVAGMSGVVKNRSIGLGCTLFAVRTLSKSEHAASVPAGGACPPDAVLPLRLFVSHPRTKGMHTVRLVASFQREKRARVLAKAGTGTLGADGQCTMHGRSLRECVAAAAAASDGSGKRAKLGCDADGVCRSHPASTQALVSRAACGHCIRKRAARMKGQGPPYLESDAYFVPRSVLRGAATSADVGAGGDVCVRRAILHVLGAKAPCDDAAAGGMCAWSIDGPAPARSARRSARGGARRTAATAPAAARPPRPPRPPRPAGPSGAATPAVHAATYESPARGSTPAYAATYESPARGSFLPNALSALVPPASS
jgi:hypothetical protein